MRRIVLSPILLKIDPNVVFAEGVRVLPYDALIDLWRVLRLIVVWVAQEESARPTLYSSAGLDALEEGILVATYDLDLRAPLAVIAGAMRTACRYDSVRLAMACLAVVDWASSKRLSEVAIAFARIAMHVHPADHFRLVVELFEVSVLLSLPDAGTDPRHPEWMVRRKDLRRLIMRRGGEFVYE